jgi:hypothetical protein
MVESLQKERAVLLAAARAAKTHPRLEEDENDREMKVSSSEPPTPVRPGRTLHLGGGGSRACTAAPLQRGQR